MKFGNQLVELFIYTKPGRPLYIKLQTSVYPTHDACRGSSQILGESTMRDIECHLLYLCMYVYTKIFRKKLEEFSI